MTNNGDRATIVPPPDVAVNKTRPRRLALRKVVVASVLTFLVGVGSVLVWPTPWRYDHVNVSGSVLPIRTHRVTGRSEVFVVTTGWQVVGRNAQNSASSGQIFPGAKPAALERRKGDAPAEVAPPAPSAGRDRPSPKAPSAARSKAVPPDELGKIDGTLKITSYDWINAEIYNGTERELDEVRILLVIKQQVYQHPPAARLRREYKLTPEFWAGSLSSSRFIASCGCRVQPGDTVEWTIVGATWK